MFGTVTVVAVALALLMYFTIDFRKQLAIRADLLAMGAYYVHFGPGDDIHAAFHDPVASPDIAKYRHLAVLDFKEAHITAESLDNLADLEKVDVIVFSLSDVRDDHLLQLKEIGSVRHLLLAHTQLTDACLDAIIDLPALETIDVTNSLITESGIERLQKARPKLTVRNL
jgi:hypothetical protein